MEFPVSKEGIETFIQKAGKESIVMVEASTGTFEFVYRIKDHLKEVYVANPHKLKLISMVKKKTDRIDAEKLAMFLKMQIMSGEELVRPVYVPEKTIKELRSLFTSHRTLTRIIVQVKNSIHGIYKQNLINIPRNMLTAKTKRGSYLNNFELSESAETQKDILLNQLRQTEENLSKIEEQIKIIGSKYYREIDILTSMKGISVIMALAIIADVADIKRFSNSKNLTSYLRSAPSVDSSNELTRIGKTNKFGRKLSITLLTQSVLHFRKADAHLDNWYKAKSKAKGKGKMRMALLRKSISQIYHMLDRCEYHYHRNEFNHNTKMKEYHCCPIG
jgi:transposase